MKSVPICMAIIGVVFFSSFVMAFEREHVSQVFPIVEEEYISPNQPLRGIQTVGYNGTLRVYVVEPTSRWKDNTNFYPYDFGFLDFALDTDLSLAYLENYNNTVTWNSSSAGFGSITSNNIMVIAVLFNAEDGEIGNSDPYEGTAPFTAHYVDAAAAATPGNQGSNYTDENYTHTVFIDEGTATWCPNCPNTRAALHAIYTSGNYHFYYAAMIVDKVPKASQYMSSKDVYNLMYLPTCYFDGGDEVLIGGYSTQSYYTDRINACRTREVPALDFTVSLNWLGDNTIEVGVSVTNLENNAPEPPAQPSGPDEGLTDMSYEFSATAVDPDGHQLYYKWDWGDGSYSDWIGPYTSGAEATASYNWPDAGYYDITVQVKDEYDSESTWSSASNIHIGIRGDANDDGSVNVGDAVYLINYVFGGGSAPTPTPAGDANCDGGSNVGDAVYIIAYVFNGGPAPGCE